MANTTLDTFATTTGASSLLSRAAAFFARVGEASDHARAARHAGKLAQLTDAQLADLGLTRDGIVAHAFRHLSHR